MNTTTEGQGTPTFDACFVVNLVSLLIDRNYS